MSAVRSGGSSALDVNRSIPVAFAHDVEHISVALVELVMAEFPPQFDPMLSELMTVVAVGIDDVPDDVHRFVGELRKLRRFGEARDGPSPEVFD